MATRDNKEVPIANPEDCDYGERYSRMSLYQFQFGAYADTKVYVWADSFDDAEEIAIEWADDNARGVFVTLTEKDLKEAAEDLGIEWDEAWSDGGAIGRKELGQTWTPFDDRDYEKIVQHAEADLITIGWTTLKSGTHVISHEVHAHEVTDTDEIEEVAQRSKEDESEEDDLEESRAGAPSVLKAANDAREILEGLGPYIEHEGRDAARESSRIARMISAAGRSGREAEAVLEHVNKIIDGHGVEAVRDENAWNNYYGDVIATYVNMGDTYATTLVYDTRKNEFHVTSWGDWYESYEAAREREDENPEDEELDESPRRPQARETSLETLPVIFRAEKSGDSKGEVTAVFPTLPGEGAHDFTVYAHMGQHSSGTRGWYNRTRAATPAEYASLLAEIKRIYERGQDPVRLQIVERFTKHHDSERRKNAQGSR